METPIQPNVLLEDGFGCHNMYHTTSYDLRYSICSYGAVTTVTLTLTF